MKKAIGWFVVLALLTVSFSFVGCAKQEEKKPASAPAPEKAAAPTAAQKKTQSLFIIERSKNANVVHYDARPTSDGKLDPKEPVIAYWVMRAEDGRREELSWMEKEKGYGFDIKPDPSVNGYNITLMAAPQQQITVKKAGDTIRAEMVIGGRQAVLEKIYINASDGLTGTKVHYVMLYGKDLKTGGKCLQKIVPK
jgi:predicted small lipoprotein YifL